MPYEHLYDGVLSHSLTYVGLAFMTGHATWRAIARDDEAPLPYERAFFRGGAVLAVAGAIANLRQTTLSMADELTLANVHVLLTETLFGQGWMLQAGFLALTVMTWVGLRWRTGVGQRPWLWLPATGALVFQGLLGHAAAVGWWSWPALLVGLHIVGAVAWLGGLLAWIALLSHGYAAAMLPPLRAFSRFAGAAMAVVLPTGGLMASLYVQAPAALFSPYGAALGAKAGLVASVLVIALGHRLWRLRRLNADAYDLAAWKRFDRWLSWEGVLAIAIVMVAAGMSQVPPPE